VTGGTARSTRMSPCGPSPWRPRPGSTATRSQFSGSLRSGSPDGEGRTDCQSVPHPLGQEAGLPTTARSPPCGPSGGADRCAELPMIDAGGVICGRMPSGMGTVASRSMTTGAHSGSPSASRTRCRRRPSLARLAANCLHPGRPEEGCPMGWVTSVSTTPETGRGTVRTTTRAGRGRGTRRWAACRRCRRSPARRRRR
jgi:hypothetical protein